MREIDVFLLVVVSVRDVRNRLRVRYVFRGDDMTRLVRLLSPESRAPLRVIDLTRKLRFGRVQIGFLERRRDDGNR